ncbi:MAG: AAA family ATPase [Chitinispirillaceae bacterium]|nr:AAA family ATPase [Chitinispirillaceae bacterium]
MNKIQVLCGLPGSKKTTWAREASRTRRANGDGVYIVSFDNIREMLHGMYVFNQIDETIVRVIAFQNIKQLLTLGFDVIIDDCLIANTRSDRALLCRTLRGFKEDVGPVAIEVIVFDRPVEKCIDARLADTKGIDRHRWLKAFDEIVEAYEPIVDTEHFDSVKTFTITN